MNYIFRKIGDSVNQALERGKSVLLLGPRQTGKTTLLNHQVKSDIQFSLAQVETRLHFEKYLMAFAQELDWQIEKKPTKPIVLIDEIQKIPLIMDTVQDFIDRKKLSLF